MSPADVAAALEAGAIPLDLRTPRTFAAGHLPGAVNLQFNRADLAERAEMLLPRDARYVIHAEPAALARVAAGILTDAQFDVAGVLEGGLTAWRDDGREVRAIQVLSVEELHQRLDRYDVLDVREPFEWKAGHIEGGFRWSWTDAWTPPPELPRDGTLAVVCGDEVRSAAACSVLERLGLTTAMVAGGMTEWRDRGFPTVTGP